MRDEDFDDFLLFFFWLNLILFDDLYLTFFCLSIFLFGLLGPFTVNGVPLRRVNQRYVIGTSTKVSLDGVDVSNIDDSFFAREEKPQTPIEGRGTFTSEARKAAQKTVDAALLENISKVDFLQAYLRAKFTLGGNDRPHALKF